MDKGVRATIGGREVPLGDDATVEASRSGEMVRYRAVVDVKPRMSEDGSHRHQSRRSAEGGRALLAVPDTGDIVPLEWVDTDEVSPCPSDCDGDHEAWYVQELRCPLCGAVLTTVEGEDEAWFGKGVEYRLRCSVLDAPEDFDAPLVVTGITDAPLEFRGRWEWEASFDSQCFRFYGVALA